MITIVDYNAGNIKSVLNMLRSLGIKSRASGDPDEIAEAKKLILPGVGHFDFGMAALDERGLIGPLNARVLDAGVPILGICLGAQLLMHGSDEGKRPGLGWIAGRTEVFDRTRMDARLRVPHMGWADTYAVADNPLLAVSTADARFYYVHSFHLVCEDPNDVMLEAQYGYPFTVGVRRGNILGVQFHPEKSHRFGMEILRRFAAWPGDRRTEDVAV